MIDAHTHFGPFGRFYIPRNTISDFIHSMDIAGIEKVIMSPMMGIACDHQLGNNIVMEFVINYPERILGYVTLNGNYESEILYELERCFSVPGFVGIKVHPSWHKNKITDREYEIAYNYSQEHRVPVLIHAWGEDEVSQFKQIAQRFPEAILIMAHAGADKKGMRKAIEVANEYENVYLDTAISSAFQGNIEFLVREVGAKKILFGSDAPYFDSRLTIGRIKLAKISDEEKRCIFKNNILSILGMKCNTGGTN